MKTPTLAQRIQPQLERLGTWLRGLSARERNIVLGGGLALLLFLSYYLIFESLLPKFHEQSTQLATHEEELRKLPGFIARYVQLKAQLGQMEATFQVNNSNLDVPAYVERIARNFPSLDRVNISARGAPTKLGQDFQQTGFKVNFATADVAALVQFLEKTIHGDHPLLVTRVDVQRASNTLHIGIEMSHIQRVQSGFTTATASS